LIGGPVQRHPEKVSRANPITYIGPDAPPFLIVHGDQDYTVLLNQSKLLHEALGRGGLDTTFHVVRGAGHGFQGASAGQRAQIDRWVDAFFDAHLSG
jgi:dipeptidyl aminopeptidase/acylaminoacyl peptidase